jgi:hypothetical protein
MIIQLKNNLTVIRLAAEFKSEKSFLLIVSEEWL